MIWTIGGRVSPRRPTEKPFVTPEMRRLPLLLLLFEDEIIPLLSVVQQGGGEEGRRGGGFVLMHPDDLLVPARLSVW